MSPRTPTGAGRLFPIGTPSGEFGVNRADVWAIEQRAGPSGSKIRTGEFSRSAAIGYELSQGNWDTAAYETFDAAASTAAVKYGKGWGALASLAYNLAGGSEAVVRNSARIGLTQSCMAQMGLMQ